MASVNFIFAGATFGTRTVFQYNKVGASTKEADSSIVNSRTGCGMFAGFLVC